MDAPLAHMQRRYLKDAADGWSNFNVTLCWRFDGPLDLAALSRAFEQLTLRHEALHTRIVDVAGNWVQRITAAAAPTITVHSPTGLTTDDPGVVGVVRRLADEPTNVRGGPLVRIHLLPCSGGHLLLLVSHHIIMDGVSTNLLYHELVALYQAQVRDGAPHLEDSVPLRAHACADLTPMAAADQAFWRTTIRPDRIDDARPGWVDTCKPLYCDPGPELPPGTVHALRAKARKRRVPLFGMTLAAVAACSPSQRRSHVVCAVVRANRDRPQMAHAVGLLVDFLPVRIPVPTAESFDVVARDAAGAWRQCLMHAAPLGAINEVVAGPTEWPRATAYDLSLNYQPAAASGWRPAHTLTDRHGSAVSVSRLTIPFPARKILVRRWACGSYPFEFRLAEGPGGALSVSALRVGDVVSPESSARSTTRLGKLLERLAWG